MEKIQNDASNYSGDRLPGVEANLLGSLGKRESSSAVWPKIITSPHGMRGRVSAFCPSDLVKQVYLSSSKFRTSNGIVGLQRDVSQVSGSHLKGQGCYVEVTLGFPTTGDNDTHNSNLKKSLLKHQDTESSAVASGVQRDCMINFQFLKGHSSTQ